MRGLVVCKRVSKSSSSVGTELRWLGIFFAIFVACVAIMLRFVVPHHYNDRIGVLVCAIVAGSAMIAIRARVDGARRP